MRVAPSLPNPGPGDIQVDDHCGPVEIFVFADTVISNGCMYLVHHKFTAKDKCGNKSECVREFRWKIITAPIQDIPFPADQNLMCQSPHIGTEDIPGTCGVGYPVFQHSDTIGNYPSDYTIIVEWKKFDCFGKFIVDTQYIHIKCDLTDGIIASKHSFETNTTWIKLDHHYWRVCLKEPIIEGTVSLIDLLGRVRLTQRITPGQLYADIDVNPFGVGVYILLLKDKTHSISHKIFIPQ